MSRTKKILAAAIAVCFFITAVSAAVGAQFVMELFQPITILLLVFLFATNLEGLGPHGAITIYMGFGFLCLAIGETMHFANHFILNREPYTPLIRFVYVLPSVFFAINQTLYFWLKLKGRHRDLSYIYVNSFCMSIIGIIMIYRKFIAVTGGIRSLMQLSYLVFIFIAFYVAMMNLQTYFLVGRENLFRGTFLITTGMLAYELMDIRYLFTEAVGKEPDTNLIDIVYIILIIMMTAGVSIQAERKYSFEFRRHRFTQKSIRVMVFSCMGVIGVVVLLAFSGLLSGTDATYIIIVLLAYIIMGYLLYAGEWNETQNERLEQMVKEKTRELTMANMQLLTAKAAAEEASKAKSDFLANMSHEIRTPINTILGMDEMILRETADPTLRKYAINIQRAGKSLLTQINDVLDFSKIEAGKMELVPDEYNLALLIADVVGMTSERAAEKGLGYSTEVNEEIPHTLSGDSVRISQILVNLLTNAVKYTKEGSVTLSADFEKKDEETILLTFAVSDTGIGIRDEDIDKLFKAFERIDEARNRTIEGTGLGMNIVWRLLNLMDSHLEVESEYGKGSRFSFTINQRVLDWEPLAKMGDSIEDLVNSDEHYHTTFTAPDAKVLLVDDTEMNLMVAKGLLKNTFLQIDTAADGKQALSMTEKKEYDLLLIDHRMPVMDGMEMIRLLRADKYNANNAKPCISVTANAVAGSREEYISAGFDDYLVKPLNSRRLEEMLLKYLPEEKVSRGGAIASEEPPEYPEFAEYEEKGYLNIREGIEYAGSPEMYRNVLSFFLSTIAAKSDEIRRYFEAGDWENYQTKVHALKSSAKVVGAEELSNRARSLELAAKDNDLDYIREHTGAVLSFYGSYKDKIKLEDDTGKYNF